MSSPTESKAGVGPIEGAFYALSLAGAWFIYCGLVFVSTLFVASATRGDIPWRGWGFIAALALIPTIPLLFVGLRRLRTGALVPSTAFSRTIFWIQILGLTGLAVAIVYPLAFMWSYLHPGGKLIVENPTEYAFLLRLDVDRQECDTSELVDPMTTVAVDFRPQDTLGFDCWGVGIETFEVDFVCGTWTCAWPVAENMQPLVLSDGGPSCDVLSFEPGYLDPPVSPPPALPPGETSPFSPPQVE